MEFTAQRLIDKEAKIEKMRDAFLSFLADAIKYKWDYDGEYDEGRLRDSTTVNIVVSAYTFQQFAEAFGFSGSHSDLENEINDAINGAIEIAHRRDDNDRL